MLRNAEFANGISGIIKSVDLKQLKGEKKMKIKRGFYLSGGCIGFSVGMYGFNFMRF